ncbi:MAG TPA: hypothetical protein VKL19_00050 [Thermoanaerobaculia bacterium]|nr:hypothetical protein [Thermoanaerobaculia bacterium]
MNSTWFYVGLLYAAAVWMARWRGNEFPWRIAVLFYALLLIFLWQPLTGPYVNLPVDVVQTLPPWWSMIRDHRVANFEINDIVMQIVPWADQVRQSWKSLHFPLWNPLSGAGYPLLANGQSSGLSPIRLLALPLPLGYAFTAEAAMKILIAMSFMFAFCRRRWSELASAFGAVSFGYCTFVQTWLHFPLVTVAVFIPAAFLTLDLLLERPTRLRFIGVVAVWAVMLLGGHPETVAHISFLAVLYVLWVFFVDLVEWRRIAMFLAAIAVAAIIASPFLAPFIEAIHKSKRYQQLQVFPNAIGYYSDFPSAVILFQPHFFGHVPLEKAWGPAVAESITGFAGVLGVAAWFGLLIRAIALRRWRSREMFFVFASVIVLGIILGWPVVSNLFHLVFALAANARLRLLLCWLLAAMTAAIIDITLRERAAYLLAGLAIAAGMLLYLMMKVPFPDAVKKDTAMIAIAPSLTVIALSLLFALPARARPFAGMVVLVAVITELWAASSGWNPVLPVKRSYPTTPLIDRLMDIRKKTPSHAPFRIVGIGPSLFPNIQAIYGLEDVRAHDPMANGRYLGVLRVVTGYDTANYFAKWENTDTRFLDFLNVKYVITGKGLELRDRQRYTMIYDGQDGRIFENRDVLPRFFAARNVLLEFKGDYFVKRLTTENDWAHTGVVKTLPVESDRMRQDLLAPRPPNAPEATVTITDATSPTDLRMRIHAPRYTLILSSQPFWPGWHIRRNGQWVDPLPVNGAFLGFTVPPGDWDVRVFYLPASFYCGLAASLITIALLIVFARR